MLTIYDWILGIAQISGVVLSLVAGIIALTMFKAATQHLKAWRFLIIALFFFAAEEVFGLLRSFGIYSNPWITHVIPSFILIFLIFALMQQINVTRGYD